MIGRHQCKRTGKREGLWRHGAATAFAHPDLGARRGLDLQPQAPPATHSDRWVRSRNTKPSALPADPPPPATGARRDRRPDAATPAPQRSCPSAGIVRWPTARRLRRASTISTRACRPPAGASRRHTAHTAATRSPRSPALGQSRQRGQHQAKFADAIDRQQDLRQRGLGPAAGGSTASSARPPGRLFAGRTGMARPRQTWRASSRLDKCDHGAHQLPRNKPANRPSMAKSSRGIARRSA